MSGDEWPRLTEPTAMDHLLASIDYTARMRHVQTGPSKGLFQFIPSRFQKGAPTMDASQKHHSDILDTLSDYLTRAEVTKITLDHDDVTDTWVITATLEVDPAHEARQLEAEMMEAVTMTTGATIPAEGPRINVTLHDAERLDFLNRPILESKVAAGLDTFTLDLDSWPGYDPETIIVLTATDSDGDVWYRTWEGLWVMKHSSSHTFTKTPYLWSELSETFGPLVPKVLADATRVAFLKSVKRGEAGRES